LSHPVKAHIAKPADEARLKNSLIALVARRRDAILEAIATSAKALLRAGSRCLAAKKSSTAWARHPARIAPKISADVNGQR
jgi:hypothetical protein